MTPCQHASTITSGDSEFGAIECTDCDAVVASWTPYEERLSR